MTRPEAPRHAVIFWFRLASRKLKNDPAFVREVVGMDGLALAVSGLLEMDLEYILQSEACLT